MDRGLESIWPFWRSRGPPLGGVGWEGGGLRIIGITVAVPLHEQQSSAIRILQHCCQCGAIWILRPLAGTHTKIDRATVRQPGSVCLQFPCMGSHCTRTLCKAEGSAPASVFGAIRHNAIVRLRNPEPYNFEAWAQNAIPCCGKIEKLMQSSALTVKS